MKEVQLEDFQSDGVRLVSPFAPDFDSRADALAPPGFADVVRDAKPYVVLVANHSPQRIIGLTLSSSNAEGQAIPSGVAMMLPRAAEENQLFIAPDAVGSTGVDFGDRSEGGIPSGRERLIGIGFEIPEKKIKFGYEPSSEWNDERIWDWGISVTTDFISRIKSQDPTTKGIRVRLDTVIFEDGLVIGRDTGNLLSNGLQSRITARQDLYRQIVDRINGGASVEEAFQPASPSVPDMMERIQAGAEFRESLNAMEAIHTVNSLRKIHGDAKIHDVLRQSILKDPFVVHRK